MKLIGLVLGIFLYVSTVGAQTVRTVLQLSDSDWIGIETSENSNVQTESKIVNKLNDIDSLTTSMSITTEIEIEESGFNLAVLNLLGNNGLFEVYLNGEKLKNEIGNENFHAEITSLALDGTIVLTLKPNKNHSVDRFIEVISNSNVVLLSGVVLCHLDVKTDPYFGSKLIEVNISNFLDVDVDGRIYARLYTADTWELVAENNNCAFARSGIGGSIEINFPDFDSKYQGIHMVAELIMVDKERNEEIIDQITFPVIF